MQQNDLPKAEILKQAREHILKVRQGRRVRAPEFPSSFRWINTPVELSLRQLRGKFVLLDFWTYGCINCMHIIPDLKFLEEKYAREPFVVIGVHSAKFSNERNTEHIARAVQRYEIRHPVLVDEDFRVWSSYAVRAWPTLVLIDPEGYILAVLSGEGHRDILNALIAEGLKIYGAEGKLNNSPLPVHPEPAAEPGGVLRFPGKISASPDGKNLLISDTNHDRLLLTDLQGAVTKVIGSGRKGRRDGALADAEFDHPQGTVFLSETEVLVADTENHLLRRVDLAGGTVQTVAGTGRQAHLYLAADDPLQTDLNSPWDLTVAGGVVYIAMAGPHQIWFYDPEKRKIGVYAGTGQEARLDGDRWYAAFAQPSGITTDGEALYIADSEASSIRSIDLRSGKVETLAGGDLFDFGDEDGVGEQTRLQHPLGVCYQDGMLYIADTYNHKIKALDLHTRRTDTIFGDGRAGFRDGSKPRFNEPGGLICLGGRLYIADTNNHRIRVADLKSREVWTLAVRMPGEAAAVPPPAGKTVSLPPVEVKSGEVRIQVQLQLPEDATLNPGSPLFYRISFRAEGEREERVLQRAKISNPNEKFAVPVSLTGKSASGELSLHLEYTYCQKSTGVCLFRDVTFRIPLRFAASAGEVIQVTDRAPGFVQ